MGAIARALALAAALVGAGGPASVGEIAWLRDVAAGEAQAQAAGKPLLLVLRCER